MANSKHDAVWEWIQTCPYIKDLFFNFSQSSPGNTTLIPSDTVLAEYIDGGSLRRYECTLTRIIQCSFEPNDTANLDAVSEFERIHAWIQEQNDAENFPAFPPGEFPTEIFVLPNESGYAVAQDLKSAKYMLQFQIEYQKGR